MFFANDSLRKKEEECGESSVSWPTKTSSGIGCREGEIKSEVLSGSGVYTLKLRKKEVGRLSSGLSVRVCGV